MTTGDGCFFLHADCSLVVAVCCCYLHQRSAARCRSILPEPAQQPCNQLAASDTVGHAPLQVARSGNYCWPVKNVDQPKTPTWALYPESNLDLLRPILRMCACVTFCIFFQWGDHIQGSCNHNILSCYSDNGAQNNWLITQYINISTTEVTDLNVSATFSTSTLPCIAGQCSQNVPVRVYWTNTPEETERNDTSNYNIIATRLLHITNDGQKESDHEDVEVPSNITGLYLALVDEGTCVSITRLVVSYNVCPEQTLNLIIYPQAIAPILLESSLLKWFLPHVLMEQV